MGQFGGGEKGGRRRLGTEELLFTFVGCDAIPPHYRRMMDVRRGQQIGWLEVALVLCPFLSGKLPSL